MLTLLFQGRQGCLRSHGIDDSGLTLSLVFTLEGATIEVSWLTQEQAHLTKNINYMSVMKEGYS